MPMQLTHDHTFGGRLEQEHVNQQYACLDVTDIAHGVGFTTTVGISGGLHDALTPLRTEPDGEYDQRLYDCLWLAHLRLLLDREPCITFTFAFPRRIWGTREMREICLRVTAETQGQLVIISLLRDLQEPAHNSAWHRSPL
jgi:hypothetical protein